MVSQYVDDAEVEMSRYAVEIQEHTAELVSLRNKVRELEKTTHKYRSLLSPVHKVPPEILLEIFKLCCSEGSFQPSHVPTPDLLAAVCGRWRDIALTSSSLFSTIRIELCEAWEEEDGYATLDQQVRSFLERSGSVTLDIFLDLDHVYPDERVTPIIEALVLQSYRWKSVELRNITRGCLQHPAFAPLGQGGLPILTHLGVSDDASYDATAHAEPFVCQLFAQCPSLKSLRLKDSAPLLAVDNLPWAQIRILETFDGYGYALDTIFRCRNVQELILENVGGYNKHEGPYNVEHITSAIRRLTVLASTEEELSCIFKESTLHSLSFLDIRGTSKHARVPWKDAGIAIIDFFQRSSCNLTILILHSIPISDTQSLCILRSLPSLINLHVAEHQVGPSNRIVTSQFLRQFTVSPAVPFLPRLTHVKFVLHARELKLELLCRALVSRWLPDDNYASDVGISCIRWVEVDFFEAGEHVKTLLMELGWMARAGAHLAISTL
ncbi:hypothetical protein VNI00_015375 [Paramarasmius palmivorus]|uniref:F-box domain-containing protein n=1 Tax=Paramarasmius palmivorus TaxID=297713 RepID=A0AAW0BMB9_9AGAR